MYLLSEGAPELRMVMNSQEVTDRHLLVETFGFYKSAMDRAVYSPRYFFRFTESKAVTAVSISAFVANLVTRFLRLYFHSAAHPSSFMKLGNTPCLRSLTMP